VPGSRSDRQRAKRTERVCIVMACRDAGEAAQVGQQLLQVNSGCLMTYRKAEDVLLNSPTARVALIILANIDDPQTIGTALKWMRRRWPRCPVAVVGDAGGRELEIAAREGGASYLARPVSSEEWAAMVTHVLRVPGRVATEDEIG